jgi:hypothetical protein
VAPTEQHIKLHSPFTKDVIDIESAESLMDAYTEGFLTEIDDRVVDTPEIMARKLIEDAVFGESPVSQLYTQLKSADIEYLLAAVTIEEREKFRTEPSIQM